jgi:hypothetical protein
VIDHNVIVHPLENVLEFNDRRYRCCGKVLVRAQPLVSLKDTGIKMDAFDDSHRFAWRHDHLEALRSVIARMMGSSGSQEQLVGSRRDWKEREGQSCLPAPQKDPSP